MNTKNYPNPLSRLCLILLFCLASTSTIDAQSSFQEVYNILQEKAVNPIAADEAFGGLDLTGTPNEVYNALVGVTADNEVTTAKGDLLVYAGQPYRSFLLKKLNNGLIAEYDSRLEEGEGATLSTTITNYELELIRQWIYAGAPFSGNVVDNDAIEMYYTDGGVPPLERPAPPSPEKGFQIHFGPVFLTPFAENEWLLKHNLGLNEEIEVRRLDVKMNVFSHHFIIYKFANEFSANVTDAGLREVGFGENNPLAAESPMVSAWAYDQDIPLPAGTAYTWDENTVLDLNYHILNYSGGGVLPGDVYINVYTQPKGTAQQEMISELLVKGDDSGSFFDQFFCVPGISTEYELTDVQINPEKWNIWSLGSHTHQLGVDYDIYLLDEDGSSAGEQVFEGKVDGYYDWSHPPFFYFEPYIELEQGAGLYQQAKYTNPNPDAVCIGLTTEDEMMLSFIQYTVGDPLPVVKIQNLEANYCTNEEAVALELTQDGTGILSGPGIVGNLFVPSEAGEGDHLISYTYEGATAFMDVVVKTAPEPGIWEEGTLIVTEEGYDSYQWYIDGQALDGETSHTFETAFIDIAANLVTVVVTNGDCSGESLQLGAVGIAENAIAALDTWIVAPNPIGENKRTQIAYQLTQNVDVQLNVYNTMGQEVRNLVNETQNAGMQTAVLDANDLSSGIYLLRLSLNGQVISKRIMVQ